MIANMTEMTPPSPELPQEPAPAQYAPPVATPLRKSRKPLIIGVSIAAGVLLLGAAITVPLVLVAKANEAKEQAIAEAEAARRSQVPDALESCEANPRTYSILGDWDAIEFDHAGKRFDGYALEPSSASTTVVYCFLSELGAPASIKTKIEQTRALDGTREVDWDDFHAEWTYHPDDGLNMLVERSED